MSGINSNYTQLASGATGSASVGNMQSQIEKLKMQCADWQGCATTPAPEKQKIVSTLTQQIQSLQLKMDKVQSSPPATVIYNVGDKQNNANNLLQVDGVNRPVAGAEVGSIINLSV